MRNNLSARMSYVLGLWAATLVLLMGLWADTDPITLAMRSVVGLVIFWCVGYLAGLLIHQVLHDDPKADEMTEEEDSNDAREAVESV